MQIVNHCVSTCFRLLQGDVNKAMYHYKKALELDPSNEIIKDNIVKLGRLREELYKGVP